MNRVVNSGISEGVIASTYVKDGRRRTVVGLGSAESCSADWSSFSGDVRSDADTIRRLRKDPVSGSAMRLQLGWPSYLIVRFRGLAQCFHQTSLLLRHLGYPVRFP